MLELLFQNLKMHKDVTERVFFSNITESHPISFAMFLLP
jgi:hypothetical protein